MIILIYGHNQSGKSSYAEDLISHMDSKKYYLATMIPYDDDGIARINRHRAMRAGLGFVTIECPYDISDIDIDHDSIVLLEDSSNLIANNIFDKHKKIDDIIDDILALSKKCQYLFIIAIDPVDSSLYDDETHMYIKDMLYCNKRLYDHSDIVIHMADSDSIIEKGDLDDLY